MEDIRDYTNDEDIDKMGVLEKYDKEHGHEEGWARGKIDEIKERIGKDGEITPEEYNGSNLSGDELEVWKFYREDVADPEAWDRLVEEYERESVQGSVKWEPYDDEKDYIEPPDSPDSKFAPPPGMTEYSGPNNKNHELKVSVEALEYFARQIDQIIDSEMLSKAQRQLADFDLRPGGFAKAEVLRQKIAGVKADDPGLRGDGINLLRKVYEALDSVRVNLRRLIKEYDSAEDFNKLTVQQFDDVMGAAWGAIGGMKDYGQSSGTIDGG